MRKWMISLFSVLALASIVTGCGGVEGNSVASDDQSALVDDNRIVNGKVASADVNEYGISPELGTPPVNPGM